MSFVEQAHYNDIGTLFKVTVYDTTNTGGQVIADISDATALQFIFQRPDDTTFTRTAVFSDDGSDGEIQYRTVDGDLNMVGTWSLQAYVATGGGEWRTNIANFKVYENL
jgi:hypothetical protein